MISIRIRLRVMYTGQPYLDSSLVNINDFQPVNHSPLEDQEQFL